MVEKGDLPASVRIVQRLLQPCKLIAIERSAVEREEADARAGQTLQRLLSLPERVVAATVHVEALVVDLIGLVVIANRSVKRYARVQQRAIGRFEFLQVVVG